MSPPWAGSSWRLTSSLLSCLLLYSPLPLSSSSGAGHILHLVPQGCQSSNLIKQIFSEFFIWSLLPLVCSVCSSPSKVLLFSPQNWPIFPKYYSYLLHHESHLPTNWGWEIKPIFFVCNVKIFRAAPSLYFSPPPKSKPSISYWWRKNSQETDQETIMPPRHWF